MATHRNVTALTPGEAHAATQQVMADLDRRLNKIPWISARVGVDPLADFLVDVTAQAIATAGRFGLPAPTLDDVRRIDQGATGSDYRTKLVLRLARLMMHGTEYPA